MRHRKPQKRRLTWTLAWAVCALIAAAGGVLLYNGRPRVPPSLPSPPAAKEATLPQEAAYQALAAAVPRAVPQRVDIPAIGVSAPITPEGTDSAGALEMPPLSAANLAAWYDGGPAPGQDGAAVIAGHVDNAGGPLVFWWLRELRPGDKVIVSPGNLVFTVTKITEVNKDAFPTLAVYGPAQGPQLRLITCGGTFDYATGHYLDNVIVFATEYKR